MDPDLLHLEWDLLFEVLIAVTVLPFLIERALGLEHGQLSRSVRDGTTTFPKTILHPQPSMKSPASCPFLE